MTVKVDMIFTGKWFTGKVLVQKINRDANELDVRLQSKFDATDDDYWWFETWDLGVTERGFETGDYFLKPKDNG
jgi:hypothetical protein